MVGKAVRDSINKGIAAIRDAGPIGWVVVVAIAALALAAFAIHAIVTVASIK